MSLTFNPRNHSYRLDRLPVPGVTTLLGKGLPKPALPYWAAKSVAEWVADNPDLTEDLKRLGGRGPTVAFLKGLPWQQRDDAAVRGTEVHALAERLAHGDEVDVPEHLAGHVRGYVGWLDRDDPEVLLTERPCASRKWWYAGTFDLICRMRGETWLLDVKTSKGVYGSTLLQLVAYGGADFYLDADGSEQPMPTIDRYGVLHVCDGWTDLYPATPEQATEAWKHWLHVAYVGRHAKTIDDYLQLPEEPRD